MITEMTVAIGMAVYALGASTANGYTQACLLWNVNLIFSAQDFLGRNVSFATYGEKSLINN
jgi:hypothetical protein